MKKILSLVLACLLLATGTFAAFEKTNKYENNFTDVKENNWFYENVKTAYELGFMNGKSEGKFDPDGNVTVAEALTMVSRLHAIYNGTEVTKKDKSDYVIEFDDPEVLVDLSERNSINKNGVNFKNGTGEIKDSMLICKAQAKADGNFDTQIKFEGLELNTKDYNKVTFRMKRDFLPNTDPEAARYEIIEFFFQTSTAPGISASRQINIRLSHIKDLTEWFEVEADLGNHAQWTDILTGFRFDPTNNNGVYYIDYIKFSKSDNIKNEKWYDMYVDYAVEKSIIDNDSFSTDEYSRNITRREICELIAKAIPEENFAPINVVKGIPDVLRDEKNSDVYLMLYKAGILLGSDDKGSLKPDSDIKRSEIAAIINRIALPENRVKGTVEYDWATQGNEYDVEFNDEASLSKVVLGKATGEIKNGALVLTATDMGDRTPRYDPQIGVENIAIAAEDYTKLKVRMKAEYIGEVADRADRFDFYFKTDIDNELSETKAIHKKPIEAGYIDNAGWYVIEVDFATHKDWKGTITGFRFDPATTNGIYTIDYIRLIKNDPLFNASHETLLSQGYTASTLLEDKGFENGLYVEPYNSSYEIDKTDKRTWYPLGNTSDKTPNWTACPLHCGIDMWLERDTTTGSTVLKDTKGANTLIYNPEDGSLSFRVDATKIYEGKPHIQEEYTYWPHLLINQPKTRTSTKKPITSDRIFVELDIRVSDLKDTINPEGMNKLQFPLFFYLVTDKAPSHLIWFGVSLLNSMDYLTTTTPGWVPDSAAHMYMYSVPMATTYGGKENSIYGEDGKLEASDEWTHIRVDITPHIDRALEWANRDNAYGMKVTKEDLYFSGGNIGFEIHGNYDCTVEIKNLDMIFYDK
ncbi:MAG: S-layer homology domain-containing protein [Clostridia bacterium]|nr:S-layer homology domain-containing protein [Clostridia bacterium]